jgi:arylsulfatase A-like enzyme
MGVKNPLAEKMILKNFWQNILFIQLKILFSYLFLGLFLGIVLNFFWTYFPFFYSEKKDNHLKWLRYLSIPVGIILLNSYFFIYNLKKYPQLYTEFFYDRSGWRQNLQIFFTDKVPFMVLKLTGLFLFVLFLISLVNAFFKLQRKGKIYISSIIFVGLVIFFSSVIYRRNNNQGPNLIIVGVDSLRKDRVNSRFTPHIQQLADEGIIFSSAYVSLPRTFPEVITLLTGKYPHNHRVRHMFPSKDEREHRDGSLPEILRKQGYVTGVVSDFAGDVFSRMNIGFDVVKAPYFNFYTILKQRSLEMHYFLLPYITNSLGRKIFPVLKEFAHNADPFLLADETKDLLKKFQRKKKFFLFLFFSTPHFPYAAPYPYYQMYTVPGYKGRYKYHKPPSIYEKENIGDLETKQIRGIYNGAVKSVDDALGEIIRFLEKEELLNKTIIIVTSDHGENLYENEWYVGHGEHFRGDYVVNIPLIVCNPLRIYPLKKVDTIVRDVDLMPTILGMLDLPVPGKIDGVSLLPLLVGKNKTLNLSAFAETGIWFSDTAEGFYQEKRIYYPDITSLGKIDNSYNNEVVIKEEYRPLIITAKHRMLRTKDYKLIYMPTPKGIIFELYDLKNDPSETRNIVNRHKEIMEKLKKQLYVWILQDKNIVFKNDFFLPLYY